MTLVKFVIDQKTTFKTIQVNHIPRMCEDVIINGKNYFVDHITNDLDKAEIMVFLLSQEI